MPWRKPRGDAMPVAPVRSGGRIIQTQARERFLWVIDKKSFARCVSLSKKNGYNIFCLSHTSLQQAPSLCQVRKYVVTLRSTHQPCFVTLMSSMCGRSLLEAVWWGRRGIDADEGWATPRVIRSHRRVCYQTFSCCYMEVIQSWYLQQAAVYIFLFS